MIDDFSPMWIKLVCEAGLLGRVVAPRGRKTWELPMHTIRVDTRKPVLRVPERKINYRFMAAEAHWILSGDDRVETIRPYNSQIEKFSDDGQRFFGAYGPKIVDQLPYVIDKLLEDNDSRQAGLTIWREKPGPSKDIPCTVAIFFNIRDGRVNTNVFMRSSDIWLGIPYDVFNFSMLTHLVCCRLSKLMVTPGTLYLTAASSHLYECNRPFQLEDWSPKWDTQVRTPSFLYQDEEMLMKTLVQIKDTTVGDLARWWE